MDKIKAAESSVRCEFAGLADEQAVPRSADMSESLLSLGRAFKMNYLISGNAFSGQPELFVVMLVSDIWAKSSARRIK